MRIKAAPGPKCHLVKGRPGSNASQGDHRFLVEPAWGHDSIPAYPGECVRETAEHGVGRSCTLFASSSCIYLLPTVLPRILNQETLMPWELPETYNKFSASGLGLGCMSAKTCCESSNTYRACIFSKARKGKACHHCFLTPHTEKRGECCQLTRLSPRTPGRMVGSVGSCKQCGPGCVSSGAHCAPVKLDITVFCLRDCFWERVDKVHPWLSRWHK